MAQQLTRPAPSDAVRRLPWAITALAVLVQISYPLTHGGARQHVAVLVVALLAAACLAHAWSSRGPLVAVRFALVSAGFGFAVEVVGVHTGVPFGNYRYHDVLGPRLAGVPLIVAAAWTMLCWPAVLVARRLARGRAARVLTGAWALVAADLFLDPQLVALGGWSWRDPDPHLPGVAHVPLTNYAGWFAVAIVLVALVDLAVPRAVEPGAEVDALPVALYLWLWVGWTVAQAVFLHMPASAAWGCLGMGLVGVPLAKGQLDAWRSARRPVHASSAAQPRATPTILTR